MSYFLRANVYVCLTANQCVFLDLRKDRYMAVPRHAAERLGASIGGWPRNLLPAQDTFPGRDDEAALKESLLEAGLITRDRQRAQDVATVDLPAPECELTQERLRTQPRPAVLARFVWACTNASRSLRYASMLRTVQAVRRWKEARVTGGSFDAERARTAVAEFQSLRWYFPRNYLCLFDSLALLNYLAGCGIAATWVFGVQTDPFQAHCWLQHERTVLNDSHEYVREFTPIMAI
jgi:hypothetical protein